MDNLGPAIPQARQQHRRAKIACKNCNARRVRCNAYQAQPCWNCQRTGASCELIVSRRGKYDRSHTKATDSASSPSIRRRLTEPTMSNSSSSTGLNNAPKREYTNQTISSPPTSESDDAGLREDGSATPTTQGRGIHEGSEMLFTRLAESDTKSKTTRINNSGRSVYLGEPFSLAFVVQRVCSPSEPDSTGNKMHYAIPDTIDEKARNLFYDHKKEREEFEFLRQRGVFDVPEKTVSDKLIHVYFECVHPAWPIFDRDKFARLYEGNTLSPLVRQIVYFLAVTMCDESLLHEAGFKSRYKARIAFYNRAKALYHADYEKDKVILVSALFLMGFWWGGPTDEKDTWHWLGDSIGLAQTMGMHRSTARSDMNIHDRRLWKRIWWSLYVRDRYAAAALGRPVRIRDEDCDVEPLEESDFEEDGSAEPSLFGTSTRYHMLYAIHMAKLAVILGNIVTTQFCALKTTTQAEDERLTHWLQTWEDDLPPELHYRAPDGELGPAFWSSMLHFAYTNASILLHRPKSVVNMSPKDTRREAIAIIAADRTTRMVEDLLAAGTFRCAQLHLVPSLFAALTVHSIVIRRADPVRRQLAENRSRQCMLGLSELSKSWPVGGWILQLFVHLMERLTGRDFTISPKTRHSRSHKRKRNSSIGNQTDSSLIYSSSPSTAQPPFTHPVYGVPAHDGSSQRQTDLNGYGSLMGDAQFLSQQGGGHIPSAEQHALWRQGQGLDFLLQDSFTSFFSGGDEWYSPEDMGGASVSGAGGGA